LTKQKGKAATLRSDTVEMKELTGPGHKNEPTFIDVLEHIGNGGVSVDRSEARSAPIRDRIRSGNDEQRGHAPRPRRDDDPRKP
jgi:hypothetical protein